jgi:ABC-2 type transport system permease protein
MKMSYGSIITWSIALILIIFLMVSIYSSFAEDAIAITDMLDAFPKELLMAFGMENLDFGSALGSYSFVLVFCQICLAIQAANYGFGLVSVEERELTADFLLAKPITRPKIMTSKLLAALTGMAVANIVVWVSSIIALNIFWVDADYDTNVLLMLLISLAVFQLFFLSVGLVVSLMVRRVRNVTPFSMALVFGLYILNAFGGMLGEESIELISPFKHFDPNYIIQNVGYDPLVFVSIAITVVSLIGSYLLYARRNIPAPV